MTTGQLIKELRLKKGLTQEDLAAKTGMSVRTIQRIENAEVFPRAYTLQTLAAALDVEFDVLNNGGTSAVQPIPEPEHEPEDKTWLPLLHLSGLFILLLPPLIIWIAKRDDINNMRAHAIDVVNFQLSMLLILIPSAILALIPIPIFIGLFSTVIIILNTIKVLNNQPYRYPMTFQFLKP